MKTWRYKDYDWLLIGAVALLTLFGIIMVYSASFPLGMRAYDDAAFFLKRQIMFFIIGIGVFAFMMHVPYEKWKKTTPLLIGLSIFLLMLVLIIGNEVNGAKSWIGFGPVNIQPAEFVKLSLIIYLAQVYSQKQKYIDSFMKGVMPPLVVVAVLLGFIVMQPDVGTAAALMMTTIVIVFLSGAKFRHMFMLGGVAAALFAYIALTEPYRLARLVSFMDPFASEEAVGGGSFQLIQGYIAIAHGGLFGVGLGESVQKMNYLPEAHTDFIIPIIAEELGIFGVLLVVGLLGIIAWRGIKIGLSAKGQFGTLLAFGIVFQLLSQAVINAGAVAGMMPITGLPFPLLSYGGSSLLITLAMLGLLANISRNNNRLARVQDEGINKPTSA
ncbi:putative lipid II flippase FtsW [Marinococcus halotolerans]|uniref:putative lipid II flippase FtsW n=1 Tax=Marinococcus halotolerans TaxID=301092 RepID=UPI0003B390C8|nr:putative lipid II flippase FtsW [Marinococcus halotolerans]